LGAITLDLLYHFHTLDDLAEDNVLAIEPAGDDGGDEELGAVGVLAGVGHGEQARLSMRQLEVLIRELLAVDGLATSAIVVGEVAALEHELGDDAVEARALVAEAVLAGAQLAKVFGCPGDNIVIELEDNPLGLLFANLDIKENVTHFFGWFFGVVSQRVCCCWVLLFDGLD